MFRCTYVFALDIKNLTLDWEYDEAEANKIISPLFDFWANTIVFFFLVKIARRPIWSEERPTQPPAQVATNYVNGVSYGQPPVTGYTYAPPQQQQQQQQQPVYMQQQPIYPPAQVPLTNVAPIQVAPVVQPSHSPAGAELASK
jgi:hypothetical protein